MSPGSSPRAVPLERDADHRSTVLPGRPRPRSHHPTVRQLCTSVGRDVVASRGARISGVRGRGGPGLLPAHSDGRRCATLGCGDDRTVNLAGLCLAGAAEQVRLIAAGDASVRELVDATLRRVEAVDPLVHAYRIVLAEQALDRAGELDEMPWDVRGVLHGVPVAVKDDTDVAGTTTTFGTAAYGPPRQVDAVVVARLRAAGAVIVGKTCVPEMDAWPWTSSVSWGTTKNPWDRGPHSRRVFGWVGRRCGQRDVRGGVGF